MHSFFSFTLPVLFSLFFSFFVFSKTPSEELVIHLNVSQPQVVAYLADFIGATDQGKNDYLSSLEKILYFDLQNCGRIQLSSKHPYKEHILKTKSAKEAFADPLWKQDRISYVIQPHIENQECSIIVYAVDYTHTKHLKKFSLEGNLQKDRRQIHKIADLIHKTLFNVDGIASTQILYAIQTPANNPAQELRYNSTIWICDYDGANGRPLTKEGSYCITPCFYPSKRSPSTHFLYVSYEKGPSKIFLSSLDYSSAEPFISLRGNQLLPTLSQDRSKIAFISDASGRADLFVQAIHPEKGLLGKPIQAYSFPSSVQASPTFSPDAKKIAFVSDKEKTPKIYILETPHYSIGRKLPEPICISKKNKDNTCPSWSPDGKKIAFSALIDGTRQICIYDLETKEESELTTGKYHKENPCWAPNSLHIVFNTADASSSDLYLINLTDKIPIKITGGPGKKHYPAWSL